MESGTGGSGQVQASQKVLQDMKQKQQKAMTENKAFIDQHIKSWPQKTKEVAAVTISKLGKPDGITDTMLVWGEKGGWKKTILHREPVEHLFPMPHKDVLEQFVEFKVPTDKFDDLAQFDGSVVAQRTVGLMSARCDKEEANYLAINLAADVANGKKSAEQARDHYAQAIQGMLQGQMDPYLTGLKIESTGQTADADQARFANPIRQMQGRSKPTRR